MVVTYKVDGKFKKVLVSKKEEKRILEILGERKSPLKYKQSLGATGQNNLKWIFRDYPYIRDYRDYFKAFKKRNQYYVSMKIVVLQHMLHLKKEDPRFSYALMGEVVGLSHAMVLSHLSKEAVSLHPDFNEIITITDKMIKQRLYPYRKEKRFYDPTVQNYNIVQEYFWKPLKDHLYE